MPIRSPAWQKHGWQLASQQGQNFANDMNSNTTEFLKYTLTLAPNNTFDKVINSISSGALLVWVIGQTGNKGNDQYIINTPSQVPVPVPVPAALPLKAYALGLFCLSRRKNKLAAVWFLSLCL